MKLESWIVLIISASCLASTLRAQTYDTNNNVVETFAGSGSSGFFNAQGTLATFANPESVVSDTASNLFVFDSGNQAIRKVAPDGTVSTLTTLQANTGQMAIDSNNTIWLVGGFYSYAIFEVAPDGTVTQLMYSGISSSSGICIDSQNNIFYSAGNQIFRISSLGVQSLWAGNTSPGKNDANGIYATFSSPRTLAVDKADNVYVWDAGNHVIRRIDANQNVSTFAGNGSGTDADGVGLNASFSNISSMYADNYGNLILACGTSIRKITATTNVLTIAGSFTQSSYANGSGALARFSGAYGVCASQGMIFVADQGNNRIRSISFNPQPVIVASPNLELNKYAGVTINGLVGRFYEIQESPDFSNWTTKATVLVNANPYFWLDNQPIAGNKYYRALLLP